LDDVLYIPRSFDIVDMGHEELGLPGYPRVPLLSASWGHGVDMLAGRDRAPVAEGDTDHGWSGCSATSSGQS
jgi:hypothetical protein